MTIPLITVIIPTFRRPILLKRAISSVINQTFPDIKVHVYDNASNDGTAEVVKSFIQKDPRIQYCCHERNIGMIGNYQYSLAQVVTPYFCFLSDDDVVFPWYCEEVLKGFQQFPECGFSTGSAIAMTEKGKVIAAPIDLWGKAGCFLPKEGVLEMIGKYPIPTCILFHRKVIDETPIDSNNALMWDCDFLIRIAARFPIFISKRPCGIFLHHASSFSGHQELECWDESQRKMAERLECNPHLSLEVKKNALILLNLVSRKRNRALIHLSLFDKKFDNAYRYAKAFHKNHGLGIETALLLIASAICKWIPGTIYMLFLLRSLKKIKRRKNCFENYKKYRIYLNEIDYNDHSNI